MEQVHEHGLGVIVQMVSQGDLGPAAIGGEPEQGLTPKPAAPETRMGLATIGTGPHRIGLEGGEMEGDTNFGGHRTQLLPPIHAPDDLHMNRGDLQSQRHGPRPDRQHVEQRQAVLAAGKCHQDAVVR